jgi:YVTN family beta-propeller protein
MKNIFNYLLALSALSVMLTTGCKKDDPDPVEKGKYAKGVLIANEGPFMDGSGSLSFYDPLDGSIENDVFQTVNARVLGNIVQSASAFDGRIYIVVNNAGKVEVAEQGSLESVGVIEGLSFPRHFVGINMNKAYVSEWGAGVAIIDLNTLSKTGSVAAGHSPDMMLLDGTRLWVVNSAGFSSDSTLTVINTQTDEAIRTIVVGDNPSGIVKDAAGKIWVICSGFSDWFNPANNTSGSLIRIHPESFDIEAVIDLPGTSFGARLAINRDGNRLFYTFMGGLYSMILNTDSYEINLIKANVNYYGLGIDPLLDEIYVSDPLDYAQPGYIFRINPANGIVNDSVKAGIIPGHFLFLN